MPINYLRYHPDWKDIIRPAVLKRANYKCEKCGVPNRSMIVHTKDGSWIPADDIVIQHAQKSGEKVIRVILTIAHLNHLVIDNRQENLKALCQMHHLEHDREHHKAMKLFAKIGNFDQLKEKLTEPGSEIYLPQAFALLRARRNQFLHLDNMTKKRGSGKNRSAYDQDLIRLREFYHEQFTYLLEWGCKTLSEHYHHPDPMQFYDKYYRSELRLLAEKPLTE